jgi:uncharacterized protein with von Willebrand factor type A (vWA) domain
MSPYEITHAGGSVEHFNEEPGMTWLARLLQVYPRTIWLNPTPERHWTYSASTDLIRNVFAGRMYPLTLAGLDQAMRQLVR